ncbi:hypothetical protein GIB67_026869 [Kingdonia uniflora]|uniref:Uncharacterized protein n=1 Tax=Kingdonia uniflora TaxID=39325 RepID=A0A7J7M869_9MAGN|nr:hypothetical protein GIB67_026869 [Kingdonia uniflora]
MGSVFRSSDVRNKYKDSLLLPKWKAFQTVICIEEDEGLKDSDKIVAFDFYGCLVNTSSEGDGQDIWSLMYPSIPAKLKGLYNNGYKMVICTNDFSIDRFKYNERQTAIDSKIGRLNNFIKYINVPIQVLVACCGVDKVLVACGVDKAESDTEDSNRKPELGMWSLMTQDFNFKIAVDMKQSFYVGSTAGKETDVSKFCWTTYPGCILDVSHLSHFADTWKCMNTANAYNKVVDPDALVAIGCLRAIITLLESNLVCEKDLVIDKSAIRSMQHFIYIENQYFLGTSYAWPSYKDTGVDNLIPMELALKIVDKIRTNERFVVYAVAPMGPRVF